MYSSSVCEVRCSEYSTVCLRYSCNLLLPTLVQVPECILRPDGPKQLPRNGKLDECTTTVSRSHIPIMVSRSHISHNRVKVTHSLRPNFRSCLSLSLIQFHKSPEVTVIVNNNYDFYSMVGYFQGASQEFFLLMITLKFETTVLLSL